MLFSSVRPVVLAVLFGLLAVMACPAGASVPCGNSLDSFATSPVFLEKPLRPNSADKIEIPRAIGLSIHVVRTSAGTTSINEADIDLGIGLLNTGFLGTNMAFYRIGPVDYIDDDFFYSNIDSASDRQDLWSTNSVPGTIDVYYTDQLGLLPSGDPAGGWSSWPGDTDAGIAVLNTLADSTILAHEIGHYFGLLHTHEIGTGIECPDGSNCDVAGDRICDTAADPDLSDKTSGCAYDGSAASPAGCGGAAYNPDPTNFMSYAPLNCISQFSAGQISLMQSVFLQFYTDLACIAVGDLALDTYVSSSQPSANFCSENTLVIADADPALGDTSALLYFTLPTIPSNEEVIGGRLELTIGSVLQAARITSHKVLFDPGNGWDECLTDHSTLPTLSPQLDLAEVGPGTTLATLDVSAAVLAWYDNPSSNLGLVLQSSEGQVTIPAGGFAGEPRLVVECTPKVPRFELSISSSTFVLDPGVSTMVDVGVVGYNGFAESVLLSPSDVPAGVSVSFSPQSISPGSTSTMTVSASSQAVDGMYSFTIVGAGTTWVSDASLDLLVGDPRPTAQILAVDQSVLPGSTLAIFTVATAAPEPGDLEFVDCEYKVGSGAWQTIPPNSLVLPGVFSPGTEQIITWTVSDQVAQPTPGTPPLQVEFRAKVTNGRVVGEILQSYSLGLSSPVSCAWANGDFAILNTSGGVTVHTFSYDPQTFALAPLGNSGGLGEDLRAIAFNPSAQVFYGADYTDDKIWTYNTSWNLTDGCNIGDIRWPGLAWDGVNGHLIRAMDRASQIQTGSPCGLNVHCSIDLPEAIAFDGRNMFVVLASSNTSIRKLVDGDCSTQEVFPAGTQVDDMAVGQGFLWSVADDGNRVDRRQLIPGTSLYSDMGFFYEAPCQVTVDDPDGSVAWTESESREIRWTGSGACGGAVDIELFESGNPCLVIGMGVPDTGSFAWTVQSCLAGSAQHEVRITNLATGASAVSSTFAIDPAPDVEPPTPNPATFAVPPSLYLGGPAFEMLAESASDASPPVFYEFEGQGPDAGSRGFDPDPQFYDFPSGSTYFDTRYRYRVRSRDSATPPNVGTYSEWMDVWSLADRPNAPILVSETPVSVTIRMDNAANPDSTEMSVSMPTHATYVDGNGGFSAVPVWLTESQWGDVTIGGLTPEDQYAFITTARNEQGATSLSIYILQGQLPPCPGPLTASLLSPSDIATPVTPDVSFLLQMSEVADLSASIIQGSQSGAMPFQVDDAQAPVYRLTPLAEFLPGELVTLTLPGTIVSSCGEPLDASRVWRFGVQGEQAYAVHTPASVGQMLRTSAVVAADFDGNGMSDLVAISSDEARMVALQNQGAGTFVQVFETTGIISGAVEATALDYNRDGHLDVAVAGWTAGGIQLFQGDGQFGFVAQPPILMGSMRTPGRIIATDLDGDGWEEVIVANWSPGDIVIFHNSNGTLSVAQTIAQGASVRGVAVGDLNSDGQQDVVVTRDGTGEVLVYLNEGLVPSKLWQIQLQQLPVVSAVAPHSVALLDYDGDGDQDVATAPRTIDSEITIFVNDGAGGLTAGGQLDVGPEPDNLASADFDGDGMGDLLVANYFTGVIEMYLADEARYRRYDPPELTDTQARAFATADLNGDGRLDFANSFRAPNSGRIYVWTNDQATVGTEPEVTPRRWGLVAVYPNPFNPMTTVTFEVVRAATCRLAIYDASGRLVRVLADQDYGVGSHQIAWNGTDDSGGGVRSGVYFIRMEAGGRVDTRRMVLLK